jgi:hypothetical protein
VATGLGAAVLGFGGKVAEDYYFGDEDAVCSEASKAMLDDKLNEGLTEAQQKLYLEKQARNAMICANRNLP